MERLTPPRLLLKLAFEPSKNVEISSTSDKQLLVFRDPLSNSNTKLILDSMYATS
jgi:hypothetical protein